MADYLKISSPNGSRNTSLEKAIIYIGEHRALLKEWRNEYIEKHFTAANKLSEEERRKKKKEYLNCGIKIITKHLGRFRITPIRYMIEPKKKFKNLNNSLWLYHKRIYARAFKEIVDSLSDLHQICPPSEKKALTGILEELYQLICNDQDVKSTEKEGLERLYSNTLLFWQKDMLKTRRTKRFPKDRGDKNSDNVVAGEILEQINKVDKPLPLP